jgi:hypothetical protein
MAPWFDPVLRLHISQASTTLQRRRRNAAADEATRDMYRHALLQGVFAGP